MINVNAVYHAAHFFGNAIGSIAEHWEADLTREMALMFWCRSMYYGIVGDEMRRRRGGGFGLAGNASVNKQKLTHKIILDKKSYHCHVAHP